MLGSAHDIDFCRPGPSSWCSTGSIPRLRYASGTAFLRGLDGAGSRACTASTGATRSGTSWSKRGYRSRARRPSDYLGEGYIMVRDPDTEVVKDALRRIVSGVRVELVERMMTARERRDDLAGLPSRDALFHPRPGRVGRA